MQERRGVETERGDRQRGIEQTNGELDQLVAELAAVDAKIAMLEERRLDAAYGTEALEMDAATTADLAQRFGDGFAACLEEAQGGGAAGGVVEHAAHEAVPMKGDVTASAASQLLPEPRGWRERMRSVYQAAVEFVHNEASGVPDGERPWTQRVFDIARRGVSAWRHRDGAALVAEIREGLEQLTPHADRQGAFDAGEGGDGGDASGPAAHAEAAEPDERPQQGAPEAAAVDPFSDAGFGAAFDDLNRLAEEWAAMMVEGEEWPEPEVEPTPDPEPDGPEPGGWDIEP